MIGFTVCSNNYIAHAKVLVESWIKFHPDAQFVVGLVDRKLPNIEYGECENVTVVPVEAVDIPEFEYIVSKYNIIELNVAVKPFYFDYIYDRYGDAEIVYLDPDIVLFHGLVEGLAAIATCDCVLTPHICSPVWATNRGPNDFHILRTGIFNLGFLMLRYTKATRSFVCWWRSRMLIYAYRSREIGLFYDQVWFNYAVVFLQAPHICKHPGYNVANWNLHERAVSFADKRYTVNEKSPLVFFHFSHYNPENPDQIASYNDRHSLSDNPVVRKLFEEYRELLFDKGYLDVTGIKCHFESAFARKVDVENTYYKDRSGAVVLGENSERSQRVVLAELARVARLG